MKVLLTGANGQLGRCFQDIFPKEWQLIATDRDQLDITNRQAVEKFVQQHKPNVVVNAAAYTSVDKAESEPKIAERINAQGPYHLALASESVGARFFHISTDYVFDGSQITPYKETDKTNPLGVYGATKLRGEQLSLQAAPNTIIIRTAWVFSEYGNNFVKTMLRLAKERDELKVVNDQMGCPTYAGDLANCLIQLIKQNAESGIYHYCGDEVMSWYEFAKTIFNQVYSDPFFSDRPVIYPILTEQYKVPAKRPKNSVLNCNKVEKKGIFRSRFCESTSYIIRKLNWNKVTL